MNLKQLRLFDVQAKVALLAAVASVVPLLGAVGLVWSRYNHVLGQIVYGAQGRFLPALMACIAMALALGGLGLILGWNSAGQRRNDRQAYSWVGFFLGGTVSTGAFIIALAFFMLRLQQAG